MAVKVPSKNLVIEDVKIQWRNFAGAAGQYNPEGHRNFSVPLSSMDEAQALESLGWKVKYAKPREDGQENDYPASLPVTVKYHPKLAPPRVKMITSKGMTDLDEEAIDVLDFVNIAKCDMILRPFHWKLKNGDEGVKNMCSSIYITVLEDELELKYADVPDAIEAQQTLAIESADVWGTGLEDMGELEEQRSIRR